MILVMFGLGGACQTQLSRNANVSSIAYGVSTSSHSPFFRTSVHDIEPKRRGQTELTLTSPGLLVCRLWIRRRPRLGFVGNKRDLPGSHQPRGDDRNGHLPAGLPLAQGARVHFLPGLGRVVRGGDRLRKLYLCNRPRRGWPTHTHGSRNGKPVCDVCGTLDVSLLRLFSDYLRDVLSSCRT